MTEEEDSIRPFLRHAFLHTDDDPKSLNICREAEAYIVAYRKCMQCINEVDKCLEMRNDPELAESYLQIAASELVKARDECSHAAYVLEEHFNDELRRIRAEMCYLYATVHELENELSGRGHEFCNDKEKKQNDQ